MGDGLKVTSCERPIHITKSRNKLSGQSIIELALILPFLLFLIVGAIELGRLFYAKIAVTNAAREGAYYLSTHADDSTNCSGGICYLGTRQAVIDEANNSGITLTYSNVTIGCSSCYPEKAIVSVDASVNNMILLTLIDSGKSISGHNGSMQVSSTVEMMVQ